MRTRACSSAVPCFRGFGAPPMLCRGARRLCHDLIGTIMQATLHLASRPCLHRLDRVGGLFVTAAPCRLATIGAVHGLTAAGPFAAVCLGAVACATGRQY